MYRKLIYSFSLILILGLTGISTAQNVDPSLVGWWTFEDGYGSVARDITGKSVDAEITGDVSWGQDKQYGGILLFNGTLDAWEYVFIDGDFNLPVYTIAMWLRVDGDTGGPRTYCRPIRPAWCMASCWSSDQKEHYGICIDIHWESVEEATSILLQHTTTASGIMWRW